MLCLAGYVLSRRGILDKKTQKVSTQLYLRGYNCRMALAVRYGTSISLLVLPGDHGSNSVSWLRAFGQWCLTSPLPKTWHNNGYPEGHCTASNIGIRLVTTWLSVSRVFTDASVRGGRRLYFQYWTLWPFLMLLYLC